MNKVAVITGTTHGIGRVTSRKLARAGYTVVMLCRDLQAADTVRAEIVATIPQAEIHLVHCDLASLKSVRQCARIVCSTFDRITLLINNAGMVSALHRMSEDGFELTFATNHLGPFLLTNLLLEHMMPTGRIINVASRIHYRGKLDLEHVPAASARYNAVAAYAQSKLANVLHTFALARRLSITHITVNCLHPGIVASNLLPRWVRVWKWLTTRTVFDNERGAQSTLFLALSNDVAEMSGQYFDEFQVVQPASPLATNVELQELLWGTSERWTDV